MKNIILIVCLFFLTAGFAAAQKPVVESWQPFAPAAEEFSIEFPVAASAKDFGGKDEKLVSRRYRDFYDGTYFFAFSDANKNPVQTKVVRDFVRGFQKSGSSTPLGNFTGEKFSFADGENFYHTILFVKTASRSYVFHTISTTERNSPVERFFASLQIKEKDAVKSADNSQAEKSFESETAADKNQNENSGEGGNGIGGGNGAPGNRQTAPTVTSNLRILFKPRAAYTDFARFYEITGTVRLRVTFLASFDIGEVVPLSRLPFGLTNAAVGAARNMRFDAAKYNGDPLSVTKVVEYSFMIY